MSTPLLSPSAHTLPQRAICRPTEFGLLCACARVRPEPATIAYIRDAVDSRPDWQLIFELAEHHGILPLLARSLRDHARGLPTEIERRLHSAYEVNARRNLWFASELRRITDRFNQEHLRAIPYKGPSLAESVYGDLGLRSFSDLDFLIPPADFERVKEVLAELGYRPSAELTPAEERHWLQKGYERSFDSAAAKYLVELQWNVLPWFYAVDLSIDDLLARSGQTSAEGRVVAGLSREDSLLILCLHAAKHLWMRLMWVRDIAETLRTATIDYPLVIARAESLGILRIVGVSYWLVKFPLGMHIPQLDPVIAGDPQVPLLGEEFVARLARSATYDLETPDYFRLWLRLRERRGDRWRCLWRLVWTPGAGEFAAVQLPETLFPLYRVVRLARLLRKLSQP